MIEPTATILRDKQVARINALPEHLHHDIVRWMTSMPTEHRDGFLTSLERLLATQTDLRHGR